MMTTEDERAEWLMRNGWNWKLIGPVKRKVKVEPHLSYRGIKLLKPTISIYRR